MENEFNLDEIKKEIYASDIEEKDKPLVLLGQIQSRIEHLKNFLQETDFKLFKCLESQLSGDEYPYDYEKLIKQRKSWREEINKLEKEV
jgi:hypothetical protein